MFEHVKRTRPVNGHPRVDGCSQVRDVEPDVERVYHQLLEALYALDFEEAVGDEGPRPVVLTLSPAAKVAWVEWQPRSPACGQPGGLWTAG